MIAKLKGILRDRWYGRTSAKPKLGHVGQRCKISPYAKFRGNLANIRIEDDVSIGDDVLVQAADNGAIRIGPRCVIKQYAQIMSYPGGTVELGAETSVNPFCVLYGHGGLSIGSKVRIATHTVMIPANHKFERLDAGITDQGISKQGIRIEDDVWIGAHCTICDGVTIGTGAIIGAGSVVTRSIPAMSVAVGVPARAIKSRLDLPETLES